jgi:hypothetical protein
MGKNRGTRTSPEKGDKHRRFKLGRNAGRRQAGKKPAKHRH